jgi:sarcosine oxidase gamma subunit
MNDVASGELAPLPLEGVVEIVVPEGSAALPELGIDVEGGDSPGSVSSIGQMPLPIAPRRWLWLNADAHETAARLGANACTVDVEGKWTAFTCGGPRARRAFAAAVDVDRVLQARGCASLTLFDCPVVLARTDERGFLVCVQSSYATSFAAFYAAALGAAFPARADGDSNAGSGCATMPVAPTQRSDGEAGAR